MKRQTKRQVREVKRACEGKQRHDSQAQAFAHARSLRKSGSRVEPYSCSHCAGWHVGHPPRSARQSKKDRGEW